MIGGVGLARGAWVLARSRQGYVGHYGHPYERHELTPERYAPTSREYYRIIDRATSSTATMPHVTSRIFL